MGARLTFVDLTDPEAIRYRHVLLVEPFLHDDGAVDVRPVAVHAGGIVWHGGHVHVAGTTRGFSSFRLDDIVRVPVGDPTRLRIRARPASTASASATSCRSGSPTTRTPTTAGPRCATPSCRSTGARRPTSSSRASTAATT